MKSHHGSQPHGKELKGFPQDTDFQRFRTETKGEKQNKKKISALRRLSSQCFSTLVNYHFLRFRSMSSEFQPYPCIAMFRK